MQFPLKEDLLLFSEITRPEKGTPRRFCLKGLSPEGHLVCQRKAPLSDDNNCFTILKILFCISVPPSTPSCLKLDLFPTMPRSYCEHFASGKGWRWGEGKKF